MMVQSDFGKVNKRKSYDSSLDGYRLGVAARKGEKRQNENRMVKFDLKSNHDLCNNGLDGTRLAFGSELQMSSEINLVEYKRRATYSEGSVDSGATAMLITPDTADRLEAEGIGVIIPYEKDKFPTVEFAGGDNSLANITGYISGDGDLICRLEIVDNLHTNLIGIRFYIDRGMKVDFSDKGVFVSKIGIGGVITSRRQIGVYDVNTGLFMADLRAMLSSKSASGSSIMIQSSAAEGSARKAYRTVGVKMERLTAQEKRVCRQFHEMMNHAPNRSLAYGVENGWWKNLDPRITARALRRMAELEDCFLCALKSVTRTVSKGSGIGAKPIIGANFTLDYFGKYAVASMGCFGGCSIRDLACGFIMVFGLKSKKSVKEAIRRWQIFAASCGHKVLGGRTDAGSVEVSKEFQEAMAELGIRVEPNPPYEPQKDTERTWRVLKDDATAALAGSRSLTEKDWLASLAYAASVRNVIGNAASEAMDPTKTPYELFTDKKPDLSTMQSLRLGDIVVSKRQDRGSFETRNNLARVMGVSVSGNKGVSLNFVGDGENIRERGAVTSLENLSSRGAVARSNRVVTMEPSETEEGMMVLTISEQGKRYPHTLEGLMNMQKDMHREEQEEEEKRLKTFQSQTQPSSTSSSRPQRSFAEPPGETVSDDGAVTMEDADKYIESDFPTTGGGADSDGAFTPMYFPQESDDADRVTTSSTFVARRAMMIIQSAVNFDDTVDGIADDMWFDFNVASDEVFEERRQEMLLAYKARVIRTEDNPSVGMVQKSPVLWERWSTAMLIEFDGMMDKGSIVQVGEERAKEVGLHRHVTTLIMKNPGESGSEKARITIDGSEDLRGNMFPDRIELYAPAMDEHGLKFIIAIAVYYDMDMSYSDVNQAFMYNSMDDALKKRSIVIQLTEFECGIPGGGYFEYNALGYGAPDAGRVWFNTMRAFLENEMGMCPCEQFQCVWMRSFGVSGMLLVGLATDDLVKAASRDRETQQFLQQLKEEMDRRWKMKHGDKLERVLGVDLIWNSDGSVTLIQNKQLNAIKEHFFPGNTPIPECWAPAQKRVESAADLELVSTKEYRQGLGKLSHSRITRLDGKSGLAIGAESSVDPRTMHLQKLVDLAAYLLTTRGLGLTFHRGPRHANIREMLRSWAASDASWSMCSTAQSRYGFMLAIGDQEFFNTNRVKTGAIVAKSKRETAISRSAATAELGAQVETIEQIVSTRTALAQVAGYVDSDLNMFTGGGNSGSRYGAKPTRLAHGLSKADIEDMLPEENPTRLLVDNRTLANTIQYSFNPQAKKMKINIRNINIMKESIKSGTIEQILVKTKDQPADMLTKVHTSPSLQWLHMEELMGTSPKLLEYQSIVAEKRRQRKPPRKVHQSGSSDRGSRSGDSGSDGDDGRVDSDDAERMVVEVEAVETDSEAATIMANGSKVVRMRDDVAVVTEKQTDEQTLVLDSLTEEARMKKSLLAKRLEKLEMEKESRAEATTAENTEWNALESNISKQIRLDIKAGISTAAQIEEADNDLDSDYSDHAEDLGDDDGDGGDNDCGQRQQQVEEEMMDIIGRERSGYDMYHGRKKKSRRGSKGGNKSMIRGLALSRPVALPQGM